MRQTRRTMLLMAGATLALAGAARAETAKWCDGAHIRLFVGGDAGDAFGTIVHNGAKQAVADTGAQLDHIFSGWDHETMTQQLREAIGSRPDGIAMMGHPGPAALGGPLAKQAQEAGIKMAHQNVDLPTLRAEYGGGYVGADLRPQGRLLGETAIKQLGLRKGDKAIVFADWGAETRVVRELGTVEAREAAGLTGSTRASTASATTPIARGRWASTCGGCGC